MSTLASAIPENRVDAPKPTTSDYVLGSSASEHRRLMVQGRLLEPYTERLFRDAGIGEGDRVLDVGSGMGDVALILARLVGPSGEVVGIDRDAEALAQARARVAAVGFQNVRFVETDIADYAADAPFDAIAGRFVLLFQPDPVAVLRLLARHLRARGLAVFQEPCWNLWRPLYSHLPLRNACMSVMQEAARRNGVHADMERVLARGLVRAGFARPQLRLEVPAGAGDRASRNLVSDFFRTWQPRIRAAGLSIEALGDLDTLEQRLDAELLDADMFCSWVGLAGAWAHAQ